MKRFMLGLILALVFKGTKPPEQKTAFEIDCGSWFVIVGPSSEGWTLAEAKRLLKCFNGTHYDEDVCRITTVRVHKGT